MSPWEATGLFQAKNQPKTRQPRRFGGPAAESHKELPNTHRDVTAVIKSMGCSFFTQQLFPRASLQPAQGDCTPAVQHSQCQVSRSRAITQPHKEAAARSILPAANASLFIQHAIFSYFHPTLLLMDAQGGWVRRWDKNLI